MSPGTRVHLYAARYYNRRGRVIHAQPHGYYLVRLDSGEAVQVHSSELEAA